ncbi:protein translocase subunit SecF [Scatolibacter rhodanostii]|uniref:protein translocase subunit SecF n=1 Tax=Scatolibacter rhodanostii TaxID=2014781 RepID=UPI000C068E5B|nr:protein translocase subunit SecF [Scatolibacter rhodanostii]
MKKAKKYVFFVVAILTVLFTYLSLFGAYGQNGDFKTTYLKGAGDIRWGIDIRGGVEATFSPADGIKADDNQLNAAKAIIETRMVNTNITDYELYKDSTNNRIIVRFPWKSDESDFNAEKAIEELSATALLTFREGMEYESSEYAADGSLIYKTPAGETANKIILEGADVVKAEPGMIQDSSSGQYEYLVSLELSEDGKTKFAEATERLKGGVISIWMDDVMISYPTVEAVISDGKCTISGNFTSAEASALASKIQAGALPFALKVSDFSAITPTLGSRALDAMAQAGVIAFIIIAILMLVFYRLPGFVAIISLAGQVAFSLAIVSGFFPAFNSFTMTLPGIAGIILSIGMGVDANIITASRIREELKNGKSLDSAIQKGSSESFWAIFDGNITVIIVALMLIGVFGPSNILSMLFGQSTTGSIYAFGYTLLLGTFGNFIMGVWASRAMVRSLSAFKPLRNKWLYGAPKDNAKSFYFDFYKSKKYFIAVSVVIMLAGVVFNITSGVKLDTQFAGGAQLQYSVSGGNVEQEDVQDIVTEATGKHATVVVNESMAEEDAGKKFITISFSGKEALNVEEQKNVLVSLEDKFADSDFEFVQSSSMDPAMGAKFLQKCLVCLAITVVFLLIYIGLRFKKIGGLTAGGTAIIALLHDVLITYFVFVIFGMPINDNFMAVILTILGYSLNDTIVIFDRIRENRRLMPKSDITYISNLSLSQTFGRSVMTSVATFAALLVTYIIAIMNNMDSVASFAMPMMIGVVAGAYSSLVIAAPLYSWLQLRQKKGQKAN